jgi:arginase
MKRNLNIINACCYQGQKKKGTELAPEYINILLRSTLSGLGIIPNLSVLPDTLFTPVEQGCQTLYHQLNKFNSDDLNLILGGDHSIAAGSIAAAIDKYADDLMVLWIDAHTDINTMESSLTKNFHGMPMASLMHIDNFSILSNVSPLKGSQVIYIGVRDTDPFEANLLQRLNIPIYTIADLPKIQHLLKDKYVHISLDIDGLDPSITPSTGTPVPKGLSKSDIFRILNVLRETRVCSIDVVEFNPLIGTAENVATTLHTIDAILHQVLREHI